MPVYDENTGNPVTYKSGLQFTEEWLKGGYNFGDQQYANVYKPDAPGEIFNVPVGGINEVIQQGYILESDPERLNRDFVTSEKGQDFSTKSGLLMDEFYDGLSMDVTAIMTKYNDNPFEAARRKAISEEHKWWGRAGYTLGTVLNMVGISVATGGSAGIARAGQLVARAGTAAITKANILAGQKIVASRLMALGKKGLTQQAADKTAKAYVREAVKSLGKSTIIGAGVGTAEMAPAAFTEHLYGNTERAGELLSMGFVIGGGLGGTFKAGSMAMKGVRDLKDWIPSDAANQAFVAASSKAFGVPEKAIEYFQKNPVAAKGAASIDDMSWKLTSKRDTEVANLATAKENASLAGKELDEVRRIKGEDMKAQSKAIHPLMADEIERDLKTAQKGFNTATEGAEDSLARSLPDKSVNASDLAHDMKLSIKQHSKLKGVQDRATFAKLKQLKEMMPDNGLLTGMEARNMLKSMRRDVEYQGPFAPRDKAYEAIVKGFARELRLVLKETPGAEQYTAAIEALAPKLSALGDFQKALRSESSRLGMASILSKPRLTGTEAVKRKAFNNFMNQVDPDLVAKYADMGVDQAKAFGYLEDLAKRGKSKDLDLKNQFDMDNFPNEASHKSFMDSALNEQEASWKSVKSVIGGEKSLSPDGLNRILLGTNKKDQMALGDFIERNDILGDDVTASVMNDAFNRSKGSGSRFLNPNVMMGGIIGGPVGMGIGAVVDRFGGEALRKILLSKQVTSYLTEGTFAKFSKQIGGITDAILKPRTLLAAKSLRNINLKVYRAAMDDVPKEDRKRLGVTDTRPTADNVGETKYQADLWKAMTHKFDKYESNPALLMQEVEEKTFVVRGDPDLAKPMGEHIMRATSYLAEEIPRDMSPPDPFAGPEDVWVPSDLDLDVFAQKVAAVNEPMSVVDALADGSITQDMTKAVAATSPKIMEMMQTRLMDSVATNPEKFDYETRLRAGFILDLPLEQTADPRAFSFFQQTFAVVSEEGDIPIGGGGDFAPKLNSKSSSTWMSKSTKISNDVYN